MFSTARKIIKKNKGLVVSSILIILALLMIVGEGSLLSFFSPIPHSGCRASIYKHPGESGLHLFTYNFYRTTGYRIVTRRYWIGNTLYIKMVGIKPPTGVVGLALTPARDQISLEGVADGSYQVVLFWSVGLLNVKVESYKLIKDEGNLSIDRIESTVTTVFLANILYFAPWLLLCIGLLYVLIYLFRRIYRKLLQETTNVHASFQVVLKI